MEKKIKVIVVTIILVSLFIPTLCLWKVKENFTKLSGSEMESSKPVFTYRDFASGKYQKSFDVYYGMNFFMRKTLLKAKNQIYEYLNLGKFHSGFSGGVLHGKNNELYERGYWYPYLMGLPAFTPEYSIYYQEHEYLAQLVRSLGMDYMYILAPDKSGYYPENLSALHSLMFKNKRTAPQPEFSAYLTQYNVPNFDTYTFLKEQEKDLNTRMFPVTGTHWNGLASSLVVNKVLAILNENSPQQGEYRINPLAGMTGYRKAMFEDNDLLRLLNLYHTPVKKLHKPQIPVYEYPEFTANNGKVIVFGDSFTNQITRSLMFSKMFAETDIHMFSNILPTPEEAQYVLETGRLFLTVYTSTKLFYPDSVRGQVQGMINLVENYISNNAKALEFTPVSGFSKREPWGMWTCADSAEMLLHIPPEHRGREITFVIDYFHMISNFTLSSAGEKIGDFQFGQVGNFMIIKVPEKFTDTADLPLMFDFGKVKSPKEMGISEDTRPLGIGFKKIFVY